jgi:hypothetical protein
MNRLVTGKKLGLIVGDHGVTYHIMKLRGSKQLGCTCADWRYKKSVAPDGGQDCKHIEKWKQQQTTKTAAKDEPKFNLRHAGEGLRDEGIPMTGMGIGAFGGAALAKKLRMDIARGATLGSGIGYAGGALANLGLEKLEGSPKHIKKGAAPPSIAHAAIPFLPGAVGGTIGAAVGGASTNKEKNKARRMLIGSAIGYGIGDVSMFLHEALKAKKAPRVVKSVLHSIK